MQPQTQDSTDPRVAPAEPAADAVPMPDQPSTLVQVRQMGANDLVTPDAVYQALLA